MLEELIKVFPEKKDLIIRPKKQAKYCGYIVFCKIRFY